MKRGVVVLLAGIACADRTVPDTGGKSLEAPVPSSGVAATKTTGSEQDIFTFPKRTKRDPSSLGVRSGSRGSFLADGAGLALYFFSDDAQGQTGCGTNCAAAWPPVIVEKIPAAKSAAIDPMKLGTLMRPDGSRQLTYGGLPLYYSDADVKPGDTWGHYAMSFGGHFALAGADGKPLGPPK